MSPKVKLVGGSMALLILTIGGLFTLYQVLFDVWMTAYPFANTNEWRMRVYERLATIIVIGFLWSVIVAWLFRHGRRA